MHWIDHRRYFGPDRRERRLALRLIERRREDYASAPPPLGAAIRHLRARVPETDEAAGREAFWRRARAVALLANAYQNRAVGDVLMGLVRKLESPAEPHANLRSAIYAEFDRLDSLLQRTDTAR